MLVTCAIIIHDQKVLVTQRPPSKSRGGSWEFPGGKVQEDESPEECIVREIMEELDISISVLHRLLPVKHDYPDLSIELLPLQCHILDGSIRLHEHIAYKWATMKEVERLELCEADRLIISQLSPLL